MIMHFLIRKKQDSFNAFILMDFDVFLDLTCV